jgi:quaternary ammonium compound-resistance protein SugE
MAWIYLILAGLLEIGWPVGIKMATQGTEQVKGILIAMFFIIMSGFFLLLAQKSIPIGTAYAIWTGIGASGTFLVGIYFFNDQATLMHYFGVLMILSGVAILKLASPQ